MYVGAVEEIMCVVYVIVTKGYSGDGCDLASTLCEYDSELLMCGGSVRSILALPLVARVNRCMYMAHVCCVAAIVWS